MPKTFEFVKYVFITMFNGVLLVAVITTWILKVTFLPKLYCITKKIGIKRRKREVTTEYS